MRHRIYELLHLLIFATQFVVKGFERPLLKKNGEEALRFLYDQHKQRGDLPDLILMDIKMPRMNGIETLAAIKQDPDLRHIPVIMLSTSTNEAEMHVCLKCGAAAYLAKPLEVSEFDDKIRPWLEEPEKRESV